MDKISVIVPIYNTEKTLISCIDSIINQKYKNLEIILVNDGSTDNSEEICKTFLRSDPRIFYYKKENGGLADARNYGIERSSGDYLSFVDSDDQLNTNFFSTLLFMMKKYNADIVSSDFIIFSNNDDLSKSKIESNKKELVLTGDEAIEEYLNPKNKRILHHAVWQKIYKKELFNNTLFEKGRLHEDLFISYKLLNKCKKYVHVFHRYYYYYQNASSITHNFNEKNVIDIYDAIQNELLYFSKDNKKSKSSICLAIEQYNYCLYAFAIANFNVKFVPQLNQMKLYQKKHILSSSLNIKNKIENYLLFMIASAFYYIKRGKNDSKHLY